MRLAVTGTLNSALFDSLLKQCQPCIEGQERNLDLDLSSAEWGYPSGLVPVASLLRMLRARGVRISVAAYPSDMICSYYCRMDFFRQFGANSPCDNKRRHASENRFVEITELGNAQIDEQTTGKLLRLLQRLPKAAEATELSRQSFIDASGELVSNTRHAYVEQNANGPHALFQAQFYPKYGLVEFCICDCGLGIKQSMEGEHHENFRSHAEAIEAALIFRNKNPLGDGAGLGLCALESYVGKNGGTLKIRSGDALKVRHGSKGKTTTELLPVWKGTIVTLEIHVDKSTDLSKIWKRMAG
jgi:hypothetical protein